MSMSCTNFKWALPIDLFLRINIVHINTPFLLPIMVFQWEIKCSHDISNHLSKLFNLCLCKIFPRGMGFCGGSFNKVSSSVISSFFFSSIFHCTYLALVELTLVSSNLQGSHILTFLPQGVYTPPI